nr:ankyrin repeat-containing protein [Tanacetum cinerariifolium]
MLLACVESDSWEYGMLLACVGSDFYDVSLKIVEDHSTSTDMAIGFLARKPGAFKIVENNLIRRITHSVLSMRSPEEEDTDAFMLLKKFNARLRDRGKHM